jgi:hypothetical protein
MHTVPHLPQGLSETRRWIIQSYKDYEKFTLIIFNNKHFLCYIKFQDIHYRQSLRFAHIDCEIKLENYSHFRTVPCRFTP